MNVETLANFKDINEIQVTWIGHATMYVQMNGLNILTDPIFQEFCGPEQAKIPGLGKLAYWRYRKAACQIQDIHNLDVVIISHNHYDHLDKGSVEDIARLYPHVQWFVPLGLKAWFKDKGCNNVVELDWWVEHEHQVDGKRFTFVSTPAQHWCQRLIMDLNKVNVFFVRCKIEFY